METTATILHADLDAFYASVEQLLDPSLRGKPIAVGGGVVLAASYEAKSLGVRGGMPGRQARELCPQLTFVSGHFKDYQRLGDAAIKVVNHSTSDSVGRVRERRAFLRSRHSAEDRRDVDAAMAWTHPYRPRARGRVRIRRSEVSVADRDCRADHRGSLVGSPVLRLEQTSAPMLVAKARQ